MTRVDLISIDDNEDFNFFMKKALGASLGKAKYKIYNSPREALKDLSSSNNDRILPKMIFLDINMPEINGLELLKTLRSNAELRNIPIIILSTSAHTTDYEEALRLGANAYVVKPSGYKDLEAMLQDSCKFWLNYAEPNNKFAA